MADNRNNREFRPRRLLIMLIGVCLFLLLVSSFSSSFNNTVRRVIDSVMMPMQKGMNQAGSFVFSRVRRLQDLYAVEEENAALRAEVEALREANARLKLKLTELDEARALLSLTEQYPEYDMVGAHIIGKNSGNWFQSFLIDKGTDDGLRVNMNVMAGGGLVGVITSVGQNYATVSTIINDGQYVSAMSARTLDTFLVEGDLTLYADAKLALRYISLTADLVPGDQVVTSNISDIYVPGLLIGYVESVTADPNQLTRSGIIRPVADFDRLDTVLVVTAMKTSAD